MPARCPASIRAGIRGFALAKLAVRLYNPLMARHFNTAGVCRPDRHYMLAPEARISQLRGLIDNEAYWRSRYFSSAFQIMQTPLWCVGASV